MALFRVHDWTDAYANAPNIPGGSDWPQAWVAPASAFRDSHEARDIDISHGDHQREVCDLFYPEEPPKGLFVFVHGGFWVRLDKSYWSHLAAGALARGFAVLMPSYPLCPEVRVRDITPSVAKAITLAANRIAGPVILSGHSAGGQIVTRLMAKGSPLSKAVLDRLSHVVSISGVHDLRPLLKTALNEPIGLDEDEAFSESPALREPLVDVPVTCWVGANERSEFIRQNALLANIWRGLGLETAAIKEPDRHHFNVIDGLIDPDSPLMKSIFI